MDMSLLCFYTVLLAEKTSIANTIAETVNIPFHALNATQSKKKDIEEVLKESYR